MIRSMTAYGRASDHFSFGRLVVEIHSVNRKMLDILIYLPKDLLRFDMDVRKFLSSELERGQLSVRVFLCRENTGEQLLQRQLEPLKQLKAGWDSIARALGFEPKDSVSFSFLVQQLEIEAVLDDSKDKEEDLKIALQRVVHAALNTLIQMKLAEGEQLAQDLLERLVAIEEQLKLVEGRKEEIKTRYRKKLLDRMQELGQSGTDIEERVVREVIILAERMDITEELVRLRTHIEQFRKHVSRSEKSVGRTLDFLTQEMLREANTLGAKSSDTDVVHIKSELDKIREQVQNIE